MYSCFQLSFGLQLASSPADGDAIVRSQASTIQIYGVEWRHSLYYVSIALHGGNRMVFLINKQLLYKQQVPSHLKPSFFISAFVIKFFWGPERENGRENGFRRHISTIKKAPHFFTVHFVLLFRKLNAARWS